MHSSVKIIAVWTNLGWTVLDNAVLGREIIVFFWHVMPNRAINYRACVEIFAYSFEKWNKSTLNFHHLANQKTVNINSTVKPPWKELQR